MSSYIASFKGDVCVCVLCVTTITAAITETFLQYIINIKKNNHAAPQEAKQPHGSCNNMPKKSNLSNIKMLLKVF